MKLSRYLQSSALTLQEFADLLSSRAGIKVHRQTVYLWTTETRMPRRATMAAIRAVTAGKVQPNDFVTVR